MTELERWATANGYRVYRLPKMSREITAEDLESVAPREGAFCELLVRQDSALGRLAKGMSHFTSEDV